MQGIDGNESCYKQPLNIFILNHDLTNIVLFCKPKKFPVFSLFFVRASYPNLHFVGHEPAPCGISYKAIIISFQILHG